jgi:glycosyltransferase involved in cell wall biosynthesis
MKIALTLYNAKFLGGGNKFTAELAKILLQEGYPVALCTADRPQENRSHDALLNIDEIYDAKPFRPTRKAKLYMSSILVALSLKRCIKKFKPDLIINADAPPATFSLISKKDVKFIQYVHWPTELQSYRHSIFLEIYRSIYWGLHYRSLNKLDAVVCNSNFTQNVAKLLWHREIPVEKFHVIYPPVDVNRFKKTNLRRKEKISCIGRLDPNKGIDMVIDAFLKIHQEFPKLTLTVAGAFNEGDVYTTTYYPKLKSRIDSLNNDRISLLVNPSDSKIIQLYNSSRIFANFNPGEHFGICAIESQAAGAIPVIAKGGGQLETVIDGKTGFLVENIDEMISSFRDILSSKHLSKSISSSAKEWVDKFSNKSFENRWKMLFERIKNNEKVNL